MTVQVYKKQDEGGDGSAIKVRPAVPAGFSSVSPALLRSARCLTYPSRPEHSTSSQSLNRKDNWPVWGGKNGNTMLLFQANCSHYKFKGLN